MKHRNPIAVLLLPIVTLGIYGIVWFVKTKNEMKRLGADIPTAWLIIIPIVNIWWLWKYCEGVGQITGESISGTMAFLLLFLLSFCGFGVVGMAIIQNEFNKVTADAPAPAAAAPPAPTTPATV
jgi:hypothetical protein